MGDVFQDRLEPVFELAAELGSGDERAHVERDQLAVAETFGHVAGNNPLRQTFDDRRFADAGLADQDGIIFGPTRQDLDHAADLGIATDDRVHLAFASQFDQIAAVLFERLIFIFGTLIGDGLIASDRFQGLENVLLGHAHGGEHFLDAAFNLGQTQEQMFDRDVLVFKPIGLGLGGVENLGQLGTHRQIARRSRHLGQACQRLTSRACDRGGIDAQAVQDRFRHGLIRLKQGREQMDRLQARVTPFARQFLGALGGFLALIRQTFPTKSHRVFHSLRLTGFSATRRQMPNEH